MRRPFVTASGLLLVVLIVVVVGLALLPRGAGQPIYTVAQVTAGLR